MVRKTRSFQASTALALAAVAAAGVALSAVCAIVMVDRLSGAAPLFLPPFTGADTATLSLLFVLGCLLAVGCHHLARRFLRIGSIRELFPK